LWCEVVHQRLDFFDVGRSEKLALEGAPEKVLCFIQRTPRDFYEMSVVLKIVAAGSFGDVCTNAVGAPYNLLADDAPCKSIPSENDVPYLVSELLGQPVNP